MNPKPKVLVGDDQIGVGGSNHYLTFLDHYSDLASYDFTADPDDFIEKARTGKYDALLIDLRWGPDIPTEGFRILDAVRDYAPVRVLHTSEEADLREKGYGHGATHCVPKSLPPKDLERILDSYK